MAKNSCSKNRANLHSQNLNLTPSQNINTDNDTAVLCWHHIHLTPTHPRTWTQTTTQLFCDDITHCLPAQDLNIARVSARQLSASLVQNSHVLVGWIVFFWHHIWRSILMRPMRYILTTLPSPLGPRRTDCQNGAHGLAGAYTNSAKQCRDN